MRVLVTRSIDDGRSTASRLAALGHEAILCPVIEMRATGAKLPAGDFDLLVATSAHAFRCLTAGPQGFPKLRDTRLAVVGARTARAAEEKGFRKPDFVAENVAGLVEQLLKEEQPGASLLYLAGRDRKPDLEAGLAAAGFALQTAEVYSAEAVQSLAPDIIRSLSADEIDAALHFSRRSAELFSSLAARSGLGEACARLRHLCLSADVAAGLALPAGTRVEISPHPTAEALLALL